MKPRNSWITSAIVTSATLSLCTGVVRAEPAFTVQRDVPVPMSDGTKLGADVYLPTQGAKFPVVLARTPYDKRGKSWFAEILAPEGYAVVLQDVRGMNSSEGVFVPFVHEKQDGLDTLDWITAQPWSSATPDRLEIKAYSSAEEAESPSIPP